MQSRRRPQVAGKLDRAALDPLQFPHHGQKAVVIAVGGRPSFPASIMPHLPHPRLLHSSQYSHQIPVLLPDAGAAYNIAVVGGSKALPALVGRVWI